MASSDAENSQKCSPDQPEITALTLLEKGTEMPTSPVLSDQSSIQTVSTATYERQEREAQDLFNQRIEKLCHDLWPSPKSIKRRFLTSQAATRLRANPLLRSIVPVPQTLSIEHLKGGGFNHITAVTLPSSYSEGGYCNLILRVPREDDSQPEHQVATLQYVRSKTSIPVPTIAATDFTCDNALEKPYVVQHRMPGIDLESIWDNLSHSQRRIVAKELGHVVKSLLSVESPLAGTIQAAPKGSETPGESPTIVPWKLDFRGEILEETEIMPIARSHGTTLGLFELYFGRWKNAVLSENLGEIDEEVKLYDDLVRIARQMDELGLFKPDANCLCHLDLHNRRNFMIQLGPDDSLEVTGILDWDEAVFAPKVVNCQPPGWLWGYDKDTHVDENDLLPWPYELEGSNTIPSTPEQRELKHIFEESAGSDYPQLAYDESSRFARTLFRLATLGLTANWNFTAAERIVKEWNLLRPSLAHNLQSIFNNEGRS